MDMTTEDYGKQVAVAIRAVQQMHSDCSRLLLEFDRKMAGWTPIYGNNATRELTYHVRAQQWMAEGVYRFYSHKNFPGVSRGITIAFMEPDSDEPILIVSNITYKSKSSDLKSVCDEWDGWYAFFDWGGKLVYDEVISLETLDPQKRIESARLIAKPLYSIKSMQDVENLMDRLPS
jgi:hypothetical protein